MIRTTLKTLLITTLPFALLFFSGCGGGDSATPAPTTSPLDTGSLVLKTELEAKLKALKEGKEDSCEKMGTQAIAAIVISKTGANTGSLSGAPDLSSIGNSANGNQCVDQLNQIIWTASRIKYENQQPWINDIQSKIWLAKQLGPVLNRIQSRVGPAFAANGIDPNSLLTTYKDDIGSFVRNHIVNRLGGASGSVGKELSIYGL